MAKLYYARKFSRLFYRQNLKFLEIYEYFQEQFYHHTHCQLFNTKNLTWCNLQEICNKVKTHCNKKRTMHLIQICKHVKFYHIFQ